MGSNTPFLDLFKFDGSDPVDRDQDFNANSDKIDTWAQAQPVVVGAPNDNDILQWDGTQYSPISLTDLVQAVGLHLTDLADTGAASPSDGWALVWDTGTGGWIAHPFPRLQTIGPTGGDLGDGGGSVDTWLFLMDATDASVTVTLMAAVADAQRMVKKVDASGNTVTVTTPDGGLIDGAVTLVLSTQYEAVKLVCDGTNWWTV